MISIFKKYTDASKTKLKKITIKLSEPNGYTLQALYLHPDEYRSLKLLIIDDDDLK